MCRSRRRYKNSIRITCCSTEKNNKLQAKNKFALLDDSQNSELNVMSYQKERNMVVEQVQMEPMVMKP